jgi:hypothetical protein
MLRIDASALDYTIIALYFATVIGIGIFWLWASTRPLIDELEDEADVTADEPPALARR